MSGLTILAWLLAAPPVAMLAVFGAEVFAGLRPLRSAMSDAGSTCRTAVLIPAHDEAGGIAATVGALRAVLPPGVELLVVADNCTDDTAARARAAGARVVERHDSARRGKGFALAFGREALAAAPPECVVVLDADCAIEGPALMALAGAAVAEGRAMQACYLQRPDRAATPVAQISSFAFLVKNLVRQRGMTRLGHVAAMTGTGMALPWPVFAAAPLASADLVEDLALGIWLTERGTPPRFFEGATVWADAASGRDLMVQRNRWERGFMAAARRRGLPLVARGLVPGSRSRLWLGLHLLVPPLALLFAAAGAVLAITVVLALLGGGSAPAIVLGVALMLAGMATLAAWHAEERAQLGISALLRAPLYVVGKLPLYRSMLRRDDSGWVRTRRPGETNRP